jgi:hypothetical protein
MQQPHRVSLQDAVAICGREIELLNNRARILDVFR